MTDAEFRFMASAAAIDDSSQPVNLYGKPAVKGDAEGGAREGEREGLPNARHGRPIERRLASPPRPMSDGRG